MLTYRVKKLVFIRDIKNYPNICMSQSPLNRAQIEQLVRQSLARVAGQQGGAARVQGGAARAQGDSPSGKDRQQGPNPLVVNISARHCHLSQASVETLFGKGHQLTPKKWLY